MNDEGVYRTAPATPGLLNRNFVLHKFKHISTLVEGKKMAGGGLEHGWRITGGRLEEGWRMAGG